MTASTLFDEAARRKLEQLTLWSTRVRAGAMKGERRSTKRGTSIEFADYRNYARGDDLRRLDWNIYARLQRPYVKLLEDEEDLAVHIIVDTSASMDWPPGESAANKFAFARRAAVALAYVSLHSNDRLVLLAASDQRVDLFGPARGRARSVALLAFADGLRAGGVTDLNEALTAYALRAGRPGLTIVISDMFSPSGYLDGVTALLARGHEVALIHTLAPEELAPPLAGDLRLIDAETGRPQEVTVDAAMRDLYARRLTAWLDGVRADLTRRGAHYILADTSSPWEKLVLSELRRQGLAR
ncbi:MAG: DUF58 domain-containing protein [Aggregatilineales bacterium]